MDHPSGKGLLTRMPASTCNTFHVNNATLFPTQKETISIIKVITNRRTRVVVSEKSEGVGCVTVRRMVPPHRLFLEPQNRSKHGNPLIRKKRSGRRGECRETQQRSYRQ